MARFARPPPGWLLMRKLLRIAGLVLDGVGLLVANNVSSPDAIPHLKRGAFLLIVAKRLSPQYGKSEPQPRLSKERGDEPRLLSQAMHGQVELLVQLFQVL